MRIKLLALSTVIALVLTACASPEQRQPPSQTAPAQSPAPSAPWIVMKNSARVNTANPFEAAARVSRTIWPATHEGNLPGGFILVDPDDWQTAALMTNFIHFPLNGPVLFVKKDAIPEVTLKEIDRIREASAKSRQKLTVMVAGTLDAKVESSLRAMGLTPEWIQADNPAALARRVDARYAELQGAVPNAVIIGSMDSPEFTLPAVNWIAHMPDPLLFVRRDEVPAETKEALQLRNGQASIYLLGPTTVISPAVEQALAAYGKVTRIAGKDAFEQAVAFASYKDAGTQFGWGLTQPGSNFSFVPVNSPALAVAAAPFSHLGKHAPLLWVEANVVPQSVMHYLQGVQPKFVHTPSEGPFNHGWLTGDETVLSLQVHGLLDEALEIVPGTTKPGHGGH